MAFYYVEHLNEVATLPSVREMNIIYDFNDEREKDVSLVLNTLLPLKRRGSLVRFFIDVEKYNPSDKDIAFYTALNQVLEKEGIILRFSGGHKEDYSLNELIKADQALDAFIKKINSPSLSPFEKYLLIYDYLSKRKYKEDGPSKEDNYLSRDIIAVMNSDYIVCEGFANLMDYLCQNVGIKCICQGLKTFHEGKEERHMNNLVQIDDDKYDIHGLYYSDVTWDSTASGRTFIFCLIPLDDSTKMSGLIIPEPFYQIFYRKPNTMIKYLDDINGFILGSSVSYSLPYHFDYYPGKLERILKMDKEVKGSFAPALEMFIKNRRHVTMVLRDIMKRKGVPNNIYLGSHYVPYGCSLPSLIATLILNDRNLFIIEQRIDLLLKNAKTPLSNEGEMYQYEDMVYYRNPDVYKTLDILDSLKDSDLNLSYRAMSKKKVETLFSAAYVAMPFDEATIHKNLYGEVMMILDDIRIMGLFNYVKTFVDKKYPMGQPIPISKFQTALKTIYQYQGDHQMIALAKVQDAINMTIRYASAIYRDGAANCFKQATAKK